MGIALLLVGCTREFEPDFVQEEDNGGIVLELVPQEALTRAGKDGVKDGVTEYNENLISGKVHLFFYANNATDDTPALKSVYADVNPTTRKVSLSTSVAEVRALFGGTNSGRKCKVFVIANYNGTTEINHENTPRYTRNQLKALVLATPTWKDICDGNGQFTPSDTPAFVMTGEAEIESRGATASPVVDGEVQMARVASKVTFSLTVSDEIEVEIYAVDYRGNRIKVTDPETGEWTGEYQKRTVTMKPNKQGMSVNLCFANDFATLSGESYEPTGTSDPNLFDYAYRPFTADGSVFKAQPFYSYPQKWGTGAANQPYLKLIIPWTPYDDSGAGSTKNYYYKIPLPEGELKRNNWYQIGLDVSILGGEEQEPIPVEIKYCVADWGAAAESDASVVSARYLSVPRKSFTMYNIEELSIPMSSSHPCEIVNVVVTKPYYGTGTAPTYSASDLQQLEAVSLTDIELKHTINNEMGSNLDCAPYTISFRVRHIDNHDYYADITVIQYPAIYIEKTAGGNAFVDGYYSLVTGGKPDQSANSRTYTYTLDGEQQSTSFYYHYGYFEVETGNNRYRVTPYGNLNGVSNGTQANTNYNGQATVPTSERENTRIHVTAFTETSNFYIYNGNKKYYIIGDPRIPFNEASQITDKSLQPYLTPDGSGNATTQWTEDQLNALKVGTSVDNIIAPAFMFASEWGRQGNGESTFQTVAKRCATYQEAGYPAGRWRLPTEAEVAFCANLQANGFIGTLFANGRYWISNGSALSISGSTVTSQTSGNSTRCVYDIWYWGEDPVVDPTYKYTVMP